MRLLFRNRFQAGQLLAEKLAEYKERPDTIVLALPRGGVPVAAEIARILQLRLDIVAIRKLGLPGLPELAMGAVASGGVRLLDREVIASAAIPAEVIETLTRQETRELERQERAYRRGLPAPDLEGQTVILVDDGVATGSTMRAALEALRHKGISHLVVAAPTMARSALASLQALADEVVAVITPENFRSVSQWYEAFTQVEDDEVRKILGRFRDCPAPH